MLDRPCSVYCPVSLDPFACCFGRLLVWTLGLDPLPHSMLCNQAKMQASAMQQPRISAVSSPYRTPQQPKRMLTRAQAEQQQGAQSNVCRTCGVDLSKAPNGCDGEGRIIGGLAALPGFGWWPIKAYRPCTAAAAAGKDYVRKGQPTNEMLFGGVSLGQGQQQESLDVMTKTAERGIEVEIKQ